MTSPIKREFPKGFYWGVATSSRPICWRTATTFARFRSYWDTKT